MTIIKKFILMKYFEGKAFFCRHENKELLIGSARRSDVGRLEVEFLKVYRCRDCLKLTSVEWGR